MAVLKMQKISICALKKDRKAILEQLQHLGVLEVDRDKEEDAFFQKMDTTGQRMKFEKAATAADQALGILDAYAPEKKSLLSSLEGKELIDRELEEKVQISGPELIKTARGIYDLDREYAELRAGIAKIENQIESLMPWMALDVPLQEGKTKRTECKHGGYNRCGGKGELTGSFTWKGTESQGFQSGRGELMLRDITLGQYYPADSVIHKLDPRVKLFATLIYIISLFCFKGIAALLAATAFLFAVIKTSKVPFRFMVKGLKAIMVLMLITALFNLFLTPGEPIVQLWIFKITAEGAQNAVLMAIRLTYLILGTSIMTLTTTPNQLTDGLEKSLMPLSKIGIPVHAIAMMMSIALRFIPILIEETDKIMKAQMARGADFESGNLIHKVKNMVPLLVPLFVSAFRRADDLAMAMEARCYNGGEGRTKMKPLKYVARDHKAYAIIFAYFIVILLCRTFLPWPM